jgi:glycosyltransferase involved in cell wall biosynthesis
MVGPESSREQDTSEAESRTPLSVIIVAENASMSLGGESYLAAQWFRELLKKGIDVHLLVHDRSKPDLDRSLGEFSSRIHYVRDTLLQKVFWHVGKAMPSHVKDFTTGWFVHLITQLMQRRVARRLIQQHKIDVIHEPSPVSPRLPSLMYGLGVPVVIGPMNGNMTFPPWYRGKRPPLERAIVFVGRRFADLANNLIPGKRRAEMLLVANERTRSALPSGYMGRVEILCENGVDPDVWRRPDALPARPEQSLRLAFLGRLVDWKGGDLVLDALARIKKQRPGAELWIIGDGPERRRLESQAEALGLSDAVTFLGWVSREECPRVLSQCDVLLHPSIFDCGGAVVLEAMALGLTVVALNWGGPSDYLAAGEGVLIDPHSRSQAVAELADAVLSLTQERRRELGKAAQQRVADDYMWPAKADHMLRIYRSVCRRSDSVQRAQS